MGIIQLSILAIGLSMDSLIIALASGALIGNHSKVNVLKIGGMLALTQMMLTIGGWLVGHSFAKYIEQYDHWIAFGILTFLGVKVISECLRNKDTESNNAFNPLNFKVMFGLSIATSIDATAVGLSLSIVNQPIIIPAIIIGAITFVLSAWGIIFGCKAGQKYNLRINLAGGIMLLIIGCSILASHTLVLP